MGYLKPRKLPSKFALGLILAWSAWFIGRPLLDPIPTLPSLYVSVGFSLIAFLATLYLIPVLGPAFVNAGLKGRDRAKVYDDDMCVVPPILQWSQTHSDASPESQGLVCASAYILSLLLFIPFPFLVESAKSRPEGLAATDFPHFQVSFSNLH